MNEPQKQLVPTATEPSESLPNGPTGAAILAAGAGCAFVGVVSVLADSFKPVARFLNFYTPTGPLSGVSSLAIVLWLATWVILAKRWQNKTVAITRVNAVAFALLSVGILLTFPPIADLLQGK